MKKCKRLISTLLVVIMVFSSLITPVSAEGSSNYAKVEGANEDIILKLFDERQHLLMQDPVDVTELNALDSKLIELGVDFLTETEVKRQFPDISNNSTIQPLANPPSSNNNVWATYRHSNISYNGKKYNVQKLIAQPKVKEKSKLWTTGARTVNFNTNWKAGVTNLIKSVATSLAGNIAPTPTTVYQALVAGWSGLKKTSDIDASQVIYKWQTATTVVFTYVRLESQSDFYQQLAYITSKCETAIGYIVDVEKWRQNGTGTWVPVPAVKTGTRYLFHTPANYHSNTKAIWAYLQGGTVAYKDTISKITISGPESKIVQTISPCNPNFPMQCE